VLSDNLQERVLLYVPERAGLTGPDPSIATTVRVKHGQNRHRKMLHYDLDSQAFYPYAAGTELLTPSGRERGQKIALQPWDAAIVGEK
jgi:hypothetical protein